MSRTRHPRGCYARNRHRDSHDRALLKFKVERDISYLQMTIKFDTTTNRLRYVGV